MDDQAGDHGSVEAQLGDSSENPVKDPPRRFASEGPLLDQDPVVRLTSLPFLADVRRRRLEELDDAASSECQALKRGEVRESPNDLLQLSSEGVGQADVGDVRTRRGAEELVAEEVELELRGADRLREVDVSKPSSRSLQPSEEEKNGPRKRAAS